MEIIFGFTSIIFIAMLISEIPENTLKIKFLKKLFLMGAIESFLFFCTWNIRLGNVYDTKTNFSGLSYLLMLILFGFLIYFLILKKMRK